MQRRETPEGGTPSQTLDERRGRQREESSERGARLLRISKSRLTAGDGRLLLMLEIEGSDRDEEERSRLGPALVLLAVD